MLVKTTFRALTDRSQYLADAKQKISFLRKYLSEEDNKTIITYVKGEISFVTNLFPQNNKLSVTACAEQAKYDCFYYLGDSVMEHFEVIIVPTATL